MAKIAVAPLVGAWIEIVILLYFSQAFVVAPLVGAWIEIYPHYVFYSLPAVAPLVGAWIEIVKMSFNARFSGSLPSWERGLKLPLSSPFWRVARGRSPRGSVD